MTKLKVVPATGANPPRPLDDAGRALWDRVQREYVIADSGGVELLLSACEATDRSAACAAAIARDGLTVVAANGAIRGHPLLRDELANRALASRLLVRLGLDVEPPGRIGRPSGSAGWTGK